MKKEKESFLKIDQYEQLIDGIMSNDFSYVDGFIDVILAAGLRNTLKDKLEEGMFIEAGVGKKFTYEKNALIRGDLICWIEKESIQPFEKAFMEQVHNLIAYLNATCYTGINDFEFHYAYYAQGSFYNRHLDRFKTDSGRKFSLVTYLNEDWQPEDGGALVLYLDEQPIILLPHEGRAVFFKSELVEHEVRPANRNRLSITGWLKSV